MHLDTVFTQIDARQVHHPSRHHGPADRLRDHARTASGGTKIRERNEDLESVLSEYVGEPVTLIPCGGGDRIAAEREQWNDGSNTLCVRPGTVVVYERNNVTNDVLYKNGINVPASCRRPSSPAAAAARAACPCRPGARRCKATHRAA